MFCPGFTGSKGYPANAGYEPTGKDLKCQYNYRFQIEGYNHNQDGLMLYARSFQVTKHFPPSLSQPSALYAPHAAATSFLRLSFFAPLLSHARFHM